MRQQCVWGEGGGEGGSVRGEGWWERFFGSLGPGGLNDVQVWGLGDGVKWGWGAVGGGGGLVVAGGGGGQPLRTAFTPINLRNSIIR